VTGRPLVVAHRGACRQARENTLEAFVRARELGADGVELDVRRTADDVLVLHHDPDDPDLGPLRALPYSELRARAPWIPTLTAVLDELADWFVNVEVKCLPWEPDADPAYDVMRAVAGVVRDYRGQMVVSSFDLDAIDAFRRVAPEIETAHLVAHQDLGAAIDVAAARGHSWLHPDRATTLGTPAPEVVRRAHEAGLRVDVWTVDDPGEIRVLADAGVDAIVTNVPDVALEVLA
jgi:glycerophosphoryl diester phosphodiesterase